MSGAARTSAAWFMAAGIAMAIGGQLHPRGSGDTVDEYIEAMVSSSAWSLSHLASLTGVLLGIAGLIAARRVDVFGEKVRPWVTAAIVGWSIAAVELVPHVLAKGELDALQSGAATPLLDGHLALQMLATPAFGLTIAALAVAVARSAGTRPAKVLAGFAVVGGSFYAAAGPLINLTENVAFAPFFAGQAGVAIWLIGTALRLRGAESRRLVAAAA